jgi:hypothetical protein
VNRWHRDVPIATPLQSFESHTGHLPPEGLERLPGVGGDFRAVGLFATAT